MKYVYFIFLFSLSFLIGGLYFENAREEAQKIVRKETVLEKVINKIRNLEKNDILEIKLKASNKIFTISGKDRENQIIRLIELLDSANIKKLKNKDSSLHVQLKVKTQEFNYYLTKSMYANNIALKNFVNLFVTYSKT